MSNSLVGEAGLKIGPILMETLVKHYFNRLRNEVKGKSMTKLRQDELLYDQAFSIVKAFLEAASHHTIEEVQAFANTRTPSPPWVTVVRLMIPISCCDDASVYLIKALGGEEHAKRIVGGTKWWQVRGVNGVDAQWISTKKDWREQSRRDKQKRNGDGQTPDSSAANDPSESTTYNKEMDEMRCILYAHGGGYYFGSVDQERYAIQRHARKINGRVFAFNYRLAPQYPFPCAIQDIIAAYLFLIKPPPGASHCPVNPAHIVVAGDSAGGGLVLALLQVLRDSDLPLPAGGVLVSPWCDMTHSFPSIHTNTPTDVIPFYGLSRHKPSTLWPPPSDELSKRVYKGLRSRIRQTLGLDAATSDHPITDSPSHMRHRKSSSADRPFDVGTTTSLSPLDSLNDQTISLVGKSGDTLRIDHQVQFYAQNNQLGHPLISSALGYLGGLPPLLFIASEKEVLRDEIVYTAHKAAYPEKFPPREETRDIYPPLKGIESRHTATPVHLQVYDDAAHVLPVLFAFTTPGKFCYRAIATFMKQVTGLPTTKSPPSSKPTSLYSIPQPLPDSLVDLPKRSPSWYVQKRSNPKVPLRRSVSTGLTRAASAIRASSPLRRHALESKDAEDSSKSTAPHLPRQQSDDVAGPRFPLTSQSSSPDGARKAGDPTVYSNTADFPSWNERMIRERVSTQGVIRPLEAENEIPALQIPPDMIGVFAEQAVKRYIDGQTKFDKKFSGTIKTIDKDRQRNLDRAKRDTLKDMAQLQQYLQSEEVVSNRHGECPKKGIKEGLAAASGSWSWTWAIDGQERPPPSSIVSRRDTSEARRLARIADQSVLPHDASISANNLWSVIVDFLTVTPDKHKRDAQSERKNSKRRRASLSRERAPTSAEGIR